jgi:hypothetical protein
VEYAFAYRALRTDRLDEARTRFAQALDLVGRNRVSPQMLGLLHSGRAVVFARDGEHAAARESIRNAVVMGRNAFDAPMIAFAVADGAEAALIGGDPARAAMLLAAAETLRGGAGQTWPWTTNVYASTRAALAPDALAAAVDQGERATIANILDYFPAA